MVPLDLVYCIIYYSKDMYTVPMIRSLILVVSENPLEISLSLDIQFPCSEILEKHLIWWKD